MAGMIFFNFLLFSVIFGVFWNEINKLPKNAPPPFAHFSGTPDFPFTSIVGKGGTPGRWDPGVKFLKKNIAVFLSYKKWENLLRYFFLSKNRFFGTV